MHPSVITVRWSGERYSSHSGARPLNVFRANRLKVLPTVTGKLFFLIFFAWNSEALDSTHPAHLIATPLSAADVAYILLRTVFTVLRDERT